MKLTNLPSLRKHRHGGNDLYIITLSVRHLSSHVCISYIVLRLLLLLHPTCNLFISFRRSQ